MNKNYQTKYDRNKERKKNMGKLCWPNTGRGEAYIPGALHCQSSTCFFKPSLTGTMTNTNNEILRH